LIEKFDYKMPVTACHRRVIEAPIAARQQSTGQLGSWSMACQEKELVWFCQSRQPNLRVRAEGVAHG